MMLSSDYAKGGDIMVMMLRPFLMVHIVIEHRRSVDLPHG